VRKTSTVEQRHHLLAQRFGAAQLRIRNLPVKQPADQLARRDRMYRPIGDEDCARTGIKERATCKTCNFYLLL
jgi:hypothetical protein